MHGDRTVRPHPQNGGPPPTGPEPAAATAPSGCWAAGPGLPLGRLRRWEERLDRWLAPAAPARRLAVLRLLVGLFALTYLVVRLPAFLSTADLSDGFEPVGALAGLSGPLPSAAVRLLVVAAPVLAAAFAAGLWFRVTGPAFAAVLLVVLTYRSSWGRLLYFDNLLLLHVLIVACSPAADDLSLRPPPLRGRRWPHPAPTPVAWGTATATPGPTGAPEPPAAGARYGWPLRLCALVTVVSYVLAGVAKLRTGGLAWLDGDTLANHVAYSAARLEVLGASPSPVARFVLGRAAWLLSLAAVVTVALELAAPLALWPRARTAWVVGTWGLHAAIAATMLVVFPYPLFLVAFAPLYRLERLERLDKRVLGPWRPGRHQHDD